MHGSKASNRSERQEKMLLYVNKVLDIIALEIEE